MAYKQKSSIGSLCNSKGPMNMGNVLANPGDTGVQKNSSPAEKSLVGNQKNLPADLVKAISAAPGKMTGSPAKAHVAGHGEKKNTFYDKQVKLMDDPTKTNTQTKNAAGDIVNQLTGLKDVKATNAASMGYTGSANTSNYNAMFQDGDGGEPTVKVPTAKQTPKSSTIKTKKVVKEQPSKSTTKDNTPPAVTGSDAVKLAKIKANKKNNQAPPEALTGSDAVKLAKKKEKKKGKVMSRSEIREAKQKDKASGMSRKEVRANKLKRKASSTRAKTTSKETAAKGGKEAQRLSRKTIRLEKKVAKQEGRVKASKM